MARIFIDGFESGDHDLWDAESNATVVSSAGLDMDGDYCLDLLADPEYLDKNIALTDEMYFAFLYRTVSIGVATNALSLANSATNMIQIVRHSSTDKLQLYRGTDLLQTGSTSILVNTTYLIEVHIKIADAGGIADVKINGISDIAFSGDTKTGADTQFNKVNLGYCDSAVGAKGYSHYDNFIMDDSEWIGDTNIQAVVPTGAGNTTDWTPSAGANWECVDEIPASDADYVSVNAVDEVDTYATGNLAGTIESVKCVQVQARAKTEGAPTPTNLKLAVRSDGTDYVSGDNLVPSSAKSFSHLWEDNPADAAPWEEADVNAMEIGIKSAA